MPFGLVDFVHQGIKKYHGRFPPIAVILLRVVLIQIAVAALADISKFALVCA